MENIRIRQLRKLIAESFGGSQSALSGKTGVSLAQLGQYLSGYRNLGEKTARKIELGSGKPTGWLDGISTNTEPGPDISGVVPLISWVQAGSWTEIIDNFSVGDAEEWLPCPVKHSPSTFVLRVRGESMFNRNGRPSFVDGDLVFVDPERPAENGSLVVVRLEDAKEATFKKLIIEGEHQYLKALNPDWPDPIIQINGDATICGVVIFKGEKL